MNSYLSKAGRALNIQNIGRRANTAFFNQRARARALIVSDAAARMKRHLIVV
jgi:hypothetical protein